MKFLSIAIKGIKEILRDRESLVMMILFPCIFMLVFGFAFGEAGGETITLDIVVLNHDMGAITNYTNVDSYVNFGENFTELLESLMYEDTDLYMFNVKKVEEIVAINMLMDRDIACIVIIPENFSLAFNELIDHTIRTKVTAGIGEMIIDMDGTDFKNQKFQIDEKNNTAVVNLTEFDANSDFSMGGTQNLPTVENIHANLVIKGDMSYINFGISQGIVSKVLEQYKNEVRLHVREEVAKYFEDKTVSKNEFIGHKVIKIEGTESFSIFDSMAPGIIVFAIVLSAIGVASTLASEVEKGTLQRLKITKMTAFDLLFGTLITWTIVVIMQILILFVTAILIGFSWKGGMDSIILAIGVGIIGGIASISLGLLMAAFSKSGKHAVNFGMVVTMPINFLIGAFFPLPAATVFEFKNYTFQIYDILPWTHTVNAMRSVLLFGKGIECILFDLVMMSILTMILFIISVMTFSKNRLKIN